MSHVQLFLLLLLLSVAYVLWKGGAPERITVGIFVAGAIGSALAASDASLRWQNVELGVLAVDAAMLAALLVLLARANRLWPIFMTGLQAVQVAGHLLKSLDSQMYPFLYWMTSAVWSYLMVLLLVVATALHRSRLENHGYDAPWNSSLPPFSAHAPASSRRD